VSEPERSYRIEIAPRTIVWLLVALVGVWVALQLWMVIVVIVVALVLVGTFDPLVSWLERRGLRRGRALVLLFILGALLLAAILLFTVPPLVSELLHIMDEAPKQQKKLVEWLSQYNAMKPLIKSITAVPLTDLMPRAAAKLLGYSSEILSAIGYAITTLFLAIYLLAEPVRAKGVLYAMVPRHHHVKLARILIELKTIVGGYMRGQLITSVAIFVFTFVLLTVFRVDDALALATFAGLTDIIPFVGGYVASAPAIVSVSGSGTPAVIIVFIAMFAYQEFESRVLVPRVYGRVLRLSPAIVLLALLVGGTLLGILGALLALPIAAGLQMVVRELRLELPGEEPDSRILARDEKAEQMYEQLAHGSHAADAGVIAGEVAQIMKENEATGGPLTEEMPAIMAELSEIPKTPSPELSDAPADKPAEK
jgi:predicted PurR-regulated permease PerM